MGILDQTWDMVTQINLSIMSLNNRVGTVEGSISNINTQLDNFSTQLTSLSNTINGMQTNINNILDLYKPINWFTFNSVRFTDSSGNTAYGSFRGAWYRPIKFLDVYSNEGVDLKLLVCI
jgi:hypothetical protein